MLIIYVYISVSENEWADIYLENPWVPGGTKAKIYFFHFFKFHVQCCSMLVLSIRP